MNVGGLKIRDERKRRGMSQKVLSELTYISESNISRIENGSKQPDENEITLLADALRLDPIKLKSLFQQQSICQSKDCN